MNNMCFGNEGDDEGETDCYMDRHKGSYTEIIIIIIFIRIINYNCMVHIKNLSTNY